MDLNRALRLIEAATSTADLFTEGSAKEQYRGLARVCHPDRYNGEPGVAERASAAFQKLSWLYEMTRSSASVDAIGWDVDRPLAKGAICDVYLGRDEDAESVVIKIGRGDANDDLMKREAAALRQLYSRPTTPYHRYVPRLAESFATTYGHANVIGIADRCRSLQAIAGHFPAGIPFRHIVWMGNRIWSALGFAHAMGVIHGAALPNHLLYRPEDHGLQLIDWTASNVLPDPEGKIPYRVNRHKNLYPPEVERGDCYPATDIYMAAASLISVADSVPDRFKSLFDWCLTKSPSARPLGAWTLQDRWKETAEREYGKPRFVPLDLELPINQPKEK